MESTGDFSLPMSISYLSGTDQAAVLIGDQGIGGTPAETRTDVSADYERVLLQLPSSSPRLFLRAQARIPDNGS